jgi:triacylglycerol lipase
MGAVEGESIRSDTVSPPTDCLSLATPKSPELEIKGNPHSQLASSSAPPHLVRRCGHTAKPNPVGTRSRTKFNAGNSMKTNLRIGFKALLGETRLLGEFLSFTFLGFFQRAALSNRRRQRRGVLLIPGFGAGDVTLRPLGARLGDLGYRIFFSGIWCNVDCPIHTLSRLEQALRRASSKTGAKVSLIGHSLGGIYARELACRFPNLIERVILLGSPVTEPLESSNRFLTPLFEFWHRRCAGGFSTSGSEELELSPVPPLPPETLIYSKTDGVVQWQSCIESGANVEVIEVSSSHCGLPYCPKAFRVMVERLAQSADRSGSLAADAAARNNRLPGRVRRTHTSGKVTHQVA